MTDKAQEHNFPKYNLDAAFWRNRWCEASAEALHQQLKLIKLEKKLAMAVEALEGLVSAQEQLWTSTSGRGLVDEAMDNAKQKLAEIGGEDE